MTMPACGSGESEDGRVYASVNAAAGNARPAPLRSGQQVRLHARFGSEGPDLVRSYLKLLTRSGPFVCLPAGPLWPLLQRIDSAVNN